MVGERWEAAKKEAWKRLHEDLEIGYLDEDIYDVLKLFFSLPYAFTKSSCSGRVTAVDARYPWSRDGTIIYKVHRPITLEELNKIVEKPVLERLWLNVQGPIIHVVAKDLDSAFKVLKLAREAGFKHSGILVANEEGWLVELTTGVRANILLKDRNTKLMEVNEKVVDTINDVLMQGKKRLKELEEVLRREVEGSSGPAETG